MDCLIPDASETGDAIDDGEYVGFGCTMPICCRRFANSALNSGRFGSRESARIAAALSVIALQTAAGLFREAHPHFSCKKLAAETVVAGVRTEAQTGAGLTLSRDSVLLPARLPEHGKGIFAQFAVLLSTRTSPLFMSVNLVRATGCWSDCRRFVVEIKFWSELGAL
jgi:hypothetical protein